MKPSVSANKVRDGGRHRVRINIHSLAFKWIATLIATSLVGVIAVAVLGSRATVTEYARFRVDQARETFLANAANYFRERGSWDGFQIWLIGSQLPPNIPSPDFIPPDLFTLIDARGNVIMGQGGGQNHLIPSPVVLPLEPNGVPVLVDSVRVGTVFVSMPPPELDPIELRFIDRANQAFLFSGLGAVAFALIVGAIFSRQILRPLNVLTRAIEAMKGGDLNQTVPIRARDEVGMLAAAFNQMSRELNRAIHLRRRMTADIAHDLRTPLMVISGYLEALQDGTLPPTANRFTVMTQEVNQLKRLIEDLRTLSLADAGELRLNRTEAAIAPLLIQIQQAFAPTAPDLHLIVRADPELPPLCIDRERMVQVLGNLMSNAIRHTPANGSITLSAKRNDATTRIEVHDTGVGIPAGDLENIFERSYRVEAAREQIEGESGLGLAIARSIIEAHGGTIRAVSQVGAGTTIVIDLPDWTTNK